MNLAAKPNKVVSKLQQLMVITRQYRERQRQQCKISLGDREMCILYIIEQYEDGIAIQDVPIKFNQNNISQVSGSTVLASIAKLWEEEFIDKVISRINPRGTTLRLTKKGQSVIEKDKRCNKKRAQTILNVLSEEDCEKLLVYADQLIEAFSKMDTTA